MKKTIICLSIMMYWSVALGGQSNDCKRTGLINKSIRATLESQKSDNKEIQSMAPIFMCITSFIYDATDSEITKLADNQQYFNQVMYTQMTNCKELVAKKPKIIAEKATKAMNFSKEHSDCF